MRDSDQTEAQQIRHVIWDWNGTLLDDTQAGVNAVNGMLHARGLPPLDLARYRDLFGFPVRHFYEAIGFRLESEDWDAMAREFHDRFLSEPCIQLHREAAGVLQRFSDAGISQSVLSASEQSILERMLTTFEVGHYFAHIFGVDNLYGHSKLDLGRALLERLTVPRNGILLIGDSLHDHEVAEALGVQCLLIAQGHQSYERLARCGAPVLHRLSDLDAWLARQVTASACVPSRQQPSSPLFQPGHQADRPAL
ncbi:MAG TPA: HAD family hydrolase [Kiritimatiellia bacterium]|nr:HAD family hydrolase [Kiritimatiellia bacterium]HRU69779.1 HAD family hydrolase [Kiritimatiellia bacterium]